MSSRVEAGMKEVLQKALAVSRELDTLQREHQTILVRARSSEDVTSLSHSDSETRDGELIGFAAKLQEEKVHAVTSSLSAVQKGLEETQLMIMVANYITSLEGDRLKLKAQVKRLCAENNWLRESLTESQQLLQEAEVSMGKLKVDKEHLEFLQIQQGGPRGSLNFNSYTEEQESEMMDEKGGIPLSFPSEGRANLPHDLSNLDASFDYEIPEKIRMLHQLALQHVNQGKPEVAIPLCRKAVQELEQKTGRNNPDLATLLNILAVIYREQGRFKEAIRVLQETLEIREHVFGPTHAAVASTLNNLSVLHGKCGDFKTAEPFCQRALEIRQALLGPNHPDVAKQFCNLAVLSSNLGRYDEVEHYYLRALEVFQIELGPDDPNVTKTMNKLANCYLKQGKYKAAEAMFKKVLKTVHTEETSGQNHREGASSERGPTSPQIGEAGYWHKLSPLESPTVTDTLRCLTDTYRGQGRMEDAAELERLSKERKLDKSHRERITRIVGEEESSEKVIEEKCDSPISTKKQGLQKNPSSKASLTWKWVVGQRTGTPKLSEQNYSSSKGTKQHKS